ncbi:MAG: regulatory protein GemA [Methylotenera sp.]|nr:regulatory protein GemA [Methylotenera sp.]
MSDLSKHYTQLVAIAKGWAIKNLAGWCDETHRDLLARHGAYEIAGRISASSMNMPQLAAALEDYEKRGWPRQHKFNAKSKGASTASKAIPPRIAMLVKLWGKLGQAGKVKNASRQALLVFCARQTAHNVPDLDSLSIAECQSITEALKSWFAR